MMSSNGDRIVATHRDSSAVWLSLIDLLAATLMVFMLVTYVQKLFSIEDLEVFWIRQGQLRFAELMQREMSEEIMWSTVAMNREHTGLVLTFSDQVLFEKAEYELKPDGRRMLQLVADVLAAAGDSGFDRVQVEGHTDPQAIRSKEYPSNNWQLSAARAIAVVEMLAADPRLSAERFSANGYSYHRPVADNDTEEGRALNRRIEIRVLFAADFGEAG